MHLYFLVNALLGDFETHYLSVVIAVVVLEVRAVPLVFQVLQLEVRSGQGVYEVR